MWAYYVVLAGLLLACIVLAAETLDLRRELRDTQKELDRVHHQDR